MNVCWGIRILRNKTEHRSAGVELNAAIDGVGLAAMPSRPSGGSRRRLLETPVTEERNRKTNDHRVLPRTAKKNPFFTANYGFNPKGTDRWRRIDDDWFATSRF
jgi:hypothetical protein